MKLEKLVEREEEEFGDEASDDDYFDFTRTERDIANKLASLYVTYRQRFNIIKAGGSIFVPKKDGKPIYLNNAYLWNHVKRKYAIAVFAGARASKFICLDVDTMDEKVTRDIVLALETIGIPRNMLHISTSGGKGYHIDLFFDDLMYTKDLLHLYEYLKTQVGMRCVEFRPTHKQSIKLPLSIHGRTGNVCWYLDRDTLKPIENAAYILDVIPFSAKTMRSIIKSLHLAKSGKDDAKVPRGTTKYKPLDEGLPRDRIVQVGTRHALMVGLAAKGRYDGLAQDACGEMLALWYEQQDQELIESSPAQIRCDIKRIVKWTYGDMFRLRSKAQEQASFDGVDAEAVLSQKTPSMRKLMFLLIALEKAKVTNVGGARLAKIMGVSHATVHNNTKLLEAAGWISKTSRTPLRNEDGTFYKPCNVYRVCRTNPGYRTNTPGVNASVMIPTDALLSSFTDVYYETMLTLTEEAGLDGTHILREWEKVAEKENRCTGEEVDAVRIDSS